VVIKGTVEERDGSDLLALLGPKDSFDSRALVHGKSGHAFLAREETLCYIAPKGVTLDLIQNNPRFASFFYREISHKLDELARDEEERRYGSLMRARVVRAVPASPAFIDASDTIEAAGHLMREIDSNALFVRDGERIGIITGMNLSKAVVLRRRAIETPVREFAHFDVVTLRPDDFVSSALVLMTKHNKRRVAVHDGERYVGILEDIDLLGFLAGSAQVVAGRIDRASSEDDLVTAAREITAQVRTLRRQGVRVEVIGEVVSDLNRRLLSRLFEMVAPAEIRTSGCLVVMGSEGRGEQTVRTDQDNGLILAGPVDKATLDAFRVDFSAALAGFGFPPCPGNVMVRNSFWSKPLSDYLADFRRWVALPDETAHMNVAIFYDARAVAGDARLLTTAKAALIDLIRGEQAYLAHFRACCGLPSRYRSGCLTTWSRPKGKGDALDLKKGGIFPIVHGIRSLAIEHGLLETATDKRIARLRDIGVLHADFARELSQTFQFLLTAQARRAVGGIGRHLGHPSTTVIPFQYGARSAA
jgi:CBS domain-containing protein